MEKKQSLIARILGAKPKDSQCCASVQFEKPTDEDASRRAEPTAAGTSSGCSKAKAAGSPAS